MITFVNMPWFGGYQAQYTPARNNLAQDNQAQDSQARENPHASRTLSDGRLPRSAGSFGSDVSLASRHSGSSARAPKGERKRALVGEASQRAYQQAIHSTQDYLMQTLQLVNHMNIAALQGKETHQNLLTQIRSTEMDAHGAAKIMNHLNRTSEALDDLQEDLRRLVQSHHKLVDTVRQDPRFDRRA